MAPIFDGMPLTVPEAWDTFRSWSEVDGVLHMSEMPTLGLELGKLVGFGGLTANHWADAYLVAFAIAGDLRLVSFDRDFARFPGLNFLHLQP